MIRLLRWLDRLVTRRLNREFTKAGLPHVHLAAVGAPRSTSPLSLIDRYHLTGLPTQLAPGVWPCCDHCPQVVCPNTPHRDGCPDCQQDTA